MGEQQFSQGEVNKIFGHVPSRTLRWWALMKLYTYDSEDHDGRGLHRKYRLENLYQIGIVEKLTSLNFQASQIQNIMGSNALGGPLNQKMEGVLLIAIRPRGEDADEEMRLTCSWHPSLANLLGDVPKKGLDWDTIQALKWFDTVIMANLQKIKQRVDKLVASVA